MFKVNTEKKHELKKMFKSIPDITKFDELLVEIEKESYKIGYEACKTNVIDSM